MLGERLKELRETKGLTQQKLAVLVNLSQQTIGHYEVNRAEPSAKTLELFADLFGTTTDFLLGRTNIKESNALYETNRTPVDTPDVALLNNPLIADLPPEAKQAILDYIEFIRKSYTPKSNLPKK